MDDRPFSWSGKKGVPVEERENSRDIDRIAAQWVARMDRASLSASEAAELKLWLAGDARRRGAFMRAKAIWMRSESAQALGPQYDPKDFRSAVATLPRFHGYRQRFMQWSSAVAASFVVVVMLAATLQMPTAYATAKGEMRTVPLGNGATVTLNTDTRIKVYDDKGQRRIRVLRGEVLIEDADTVHPTLVEIDGKHLEASTATFVVRKLEGQPTQVLVQDGRVVLADMRESRKKIPLTPNTGLSLPEGNKEAWNPTSLSSGQMGRELAWREGKIALQGETLAEAAAVYARYSDTPIVIADQDLAKMQVTGLFAANNPLGFSRAVAEVFGAEVRQERGRIIVAKRH
jgi:transmembrane sensor